MVMIISYLLVFGRNRFVLLGLAPSRMSRAVRSSGLIFLNVVLILVFGDAIDLTILAPPRTESFGSMSKSSFMLSFLQRRSSSFQSILPEVFRAAATEVDLNLYNSEKNVSLSL